MEQSTQRVIKFRAWDRVAKLWTRFALSSAICGSLKLVSSDLENICQFTGLTDKKGKEIYEGDIVRIESESGNHLVEFVQDLDGGRYQFTDPNRGRFCGFREQKKEVIGNVYENPDRASWQPSS
jgi:uncharacterized phage protein (TIGR01671 family)